MEWVLWVGNAVAWTGFGWYLANRRYRRRVKWVIESLERLHPDTSPLKAVLNGWHPVPDDLKRETPEVDGNFFGDYGRFDPYVRPDPRG